MRLFFRTDMRVLALLSKVSSQFDDQRGILRKEDLEMPDFLKPKPSPVPASRAHASPLSSKSADNFDDATAPQVTSLHTPPQKTRDAQDELTPSRFPYMDASFSADGHLPSHVAAESLFHEEDDGDADDVDFNTSGLMERSRVDIGLLSGEAPASAKAPRTTTQTDADVHDAKPSVYRALIPPAADAHDDDVTLVRALPTQRFTQSASNTPVPRPRAAHRAAHSRHAHADAESTCSDASGQGHSTHSSDLDSTLMPPSDDESVSGVARQPTTPRGVLTIDPSRQKFFPATSPRTARRTLVASIVSPRLQRPPKDGPAVTSPRSPLTSHNKFLIPSPRGSTPSPTTHDLVLAGSSGSADEVSPRSPTARLTRPALPFPAHRLATSHADQAEVEGAMRARVPRRHRPRTSSSSSPEHLQISFV